ncbi:methyltransferase domain-containing protein [Candidatus Uhrbacteria bacterium]|nr:methyltransferase domain-containing protein [Candidatus Uhrbacteria bacterium]
MKQSTSWGAHAQWYDQYLRCQKDSYQTTVILPNLLRILSLKKGDRVLDLACGQGFFSESFTREGATVVGVDIAPELIELARTQCSKAIAFHVAPAHKLTMIDDRSVDIVVIVLAIQNIDNATEVIQECARVLKPAGRLVVVMNHPCFRVPQKSDWGWDGKGNIQYRRVDGYLRDVQVPIAMHPGSDPTASTIAFHRPLQWYAKAFAKNHFGITRLEEWISNKKSQRGPRAAAEDKARKEFPLFLCIEGRLL